MKICLSGTDFLHLKRHLNSTLRLFDISGSVDRYSPLGIDPDIGYQRAGF